MRPAERENRPEPPSWFEPRWRIPAARHPEPYVRRSGAATRRAELAARWAARPVAPPQRGGRELSDRPQHRRVSEWAAARCDEIAGDVARGGLWRFTEVVADVLHPGLGAAVAAAQRTTKWGPQLIGLNDDRGADVKIGLVGSENIGLWVLFRTRLGQADPGPRPDWCTDLPVGPLGREGVRREASVLSGIEDVKPADVAGLLLVPPAAGADTRVLARVDVRSRAGVLAVDPGDGAWQRRLFFTVIHPGHAGDHNRYRVNCPVCARRRLIQFRGFEVCSDCGWRTEKAGR